MDYDEISKFSNDNNDKQKHTPSTWEKIKSFSYIPFAVFILIASFIVTGNNLQLRLMGNRTIGHVIQVHQATRGITLTVQYEVNGQVFIERVRGNGFTRVPQQNETIQLFYSPRNPSRVSSMRGAYPGFFIFGILIITMIWAFIYGILIEKRAKNLQ